MNSSGIFIDVLHNVTYTLVITHYDNYICIYKID